MTESTYVYPQRIGFFFGAGASAEFGIPSMKRITSTFSTKINRKGANKEEKRVYNKVYASLKEIYGKNRVDLEFSKIQPCIQ